MTPHPGLPALPLTLHVFTFKTGLFSRLAHDLRLSLGEFELALSAGDLQGWFGLRTFRVDGVMRDGRLETDALRDRDKTQIVDTIRGEILHTDRHPRAAYRGALRRDGPAHWSIQGTLQLCGAEQPQPCAIELAGEQVRARSELVPSRYGIAPYAALGGAIRLQDRVLLAAESALGAGAIESQLADPKVYVSAAARADATLRKV